MAKQRMVNTKFWSDPFIQGLKANEKLVYLYLITNERTSICGIYEISDTTISFDTGIPKDSLSQAVDSLVQSGKVRRWENWVFLVNFPKNQKDNPSVQEGIARAIKELPQGVYDRLYTDWVQPGTLKPKLELELEPKLELEKSPTEIEQAPEYGKVEINKMLEALKGKTGIDDFADSVKWSRIYGKHLVSLIGKLGKDEFVRRLDIILEDDFKRKNCNKIKYVYEQIKGFIEPHNDISRYQF